MVDAYANIAAISDPLVLKAMRTVRREEFVLPRYRGRAYREMALAINAGQTISQPLVVALMTDLLDLQPGERVLEVGTGSGYQGAVLAEITDRVYSIEIIPSLAAEAADRLDRLGYGDIRLRQADGYFGWEEGSALRRHHRDRGPRPRAPATAQAACRWRQDDHPRRSARGRADPVARRAQRRRVHTDQPGRSEVRPIHQGRSLSDCLAASTVPI